MKKTVTVLFAAMLLFTGVMAQSEAPDQPVEDQPEQPEDVNRTIPEMPDLPDSASDVAKNVTDTISQGFSNLGERLSNLLGN